LDIDGKPLTGEGFDGLMQSALAHHRAGRLEEAARQYEAALILQPGDADALHYTGVLAHQRGDHDKAVELIERAVKARPGAPQMLCNLAEAQRAAGRPGEAEASCRQALVLRADYPEAQLNLAAALFQQRRFTDSEAAARAALELRPNLTGAALALADALREQRRVLDAEQAYRQVLAVAPNHGPALTNLGWMLVQAGQMEEGLELCRRAAAETADSALPLQNLGRALLEYGRLDEAMEALERALEREPNSPQLSLLIGTAWHELGDIVEARTWLERALHLDTSLLEARVRIAGLEGEVDNHEGAIEILDSVLAIDPARVDALVARAKARLSLGDVAAAVADQRAAIRLRPDAAALHAALGAILSSAGDLEGAVACQREAIALNKRCVPAYAGLLATLRHKATPAERDAAIALLDAPWMTDPWRASLRFGLAAYHDGRRDWVQAAEQMVQANALRKAADARRHRTYDSGQYEAFADRIIETFDAALFARLKGLGSASERPVFIVGMPRSGTTLTEQIIASHPQVFGAGERRFAQRGLGFLPHVMGRPQLDPLSCLPDIGPEALQAVADWHLGQLAALDHGKAARIVDKMPDNYSLLGWLAVLFPRARFIHCRRDPRDVALSCWITNFTAIRWANDLDHMTRRILQYRRLMDHWRQVLPTPVLEVDYEAMVADQVGQSRRLIDWLGLAWDERCLSFFKTERLVRTASVAQVRQPIYKRSVARWRHYENMLAPLLADLDSAGPPQGAARARADPASGAKNGRNQSVQ
jgi:tetratricopeptide (TPR) repeat protein